MAKKPTKKSAKTDKGEETPARKRRKKTASSLKK